MNAGLARTTEAGDAAGTATPSGVVDVLVVLVLVVLVLVVEVLVVDVVVASHGTGAVWNVTRRVAA